MPNNPSLYELELDNSMEDTGSRLSTGYQIPDYLQKYAQDTNSLDRAAELKKKELFRKGKLQYEDNGELINDSNAMIRAKEIANTGIGATDWLLEASENIADFGQGDWINDNDRFKAEIEGKKYNMSNKDIIGARELGPNATEILAQQYRDAPEDPMAKGGVYTLKKFDGYNPDGTTRYIYKYGYAHDGALERYKDQWVQDGFQIVDEKKFVGAEDWENKWHATPEALANRTLDPGGVYDETGKYVSRDKASGINFGDGKTELYNKDLLGVDLGKTQEDYDRNKLKSQAMQNAFNRRPKDSNWIDALQSGSVSMVSNLGDFILDALTPGNNTLLDDLSDSDYTDKMFGFDRVGQTQKLHEALGAFKEGNIVDAVKNTALAAPSLLAESIPYMIGMSVGAGEASAAMNVAKAINGINKAKKAGATAEQIASMTNRLQKMKGYNTYKKYEDMPNIMAKADALLKNKGFLATHTANVEDQLDQRVQNKLAAGEDPELGIGEMATIWTYMLPFTYLDKIAFTDALKAKGLNDVIKRAIEVAPKDVRSNMFTKAIGNAARIAGSGSEEAAQEYLQTWSEIFGSNWGVGGKTFQDVLSTEALQDEALMGAIGGLGAGGLTSGVTSAPRIVKDIGTGLVKRRNQKKKINNAEAIINNLDDIDFNLLMEDWNQVLDENKEVINNIKDINDATQKASTVEDLINSPIENIREFGNKVRDLARNIAVQDESLTQEVGEELGSHMAILEHVDKDGNFKTEAAPQLYEMLGIDPTEPEWTKGPQKERSERNAKAIAQAYEALSAEDKLKIHELDAMEGIQNPVLINTNLYTGAKDNILRDIEKKAFEENGIVNTRLKVEEAKSKKAEKLVKDQEQKIQNYKQARDEAVNSGSANKEFKTEDINLLAYEKDPVGFINKIKSFGRKSKIVEKIKNYSDESLKKAFNNKLASQAMKAAINQVLETRNKVKTTTTELERTSDVYDTQIDNLKTRYTSEALKDIEKILSDKEYNYAEERDDAIRFINEAYARGKITQEQRNALVLEVGLKSIASHAPDKKDKKSLKIRADKARFNKDFKDIENQYLKGEISENEKIKKQNEIIQKYSAGSLEYAGEKNLGKTKQIPKYNKETFNAIRKYAGKNKIEYTQERDRALAIIDAAVKAGHITKKQAETFKNRIKKISEGAVENPDNTAYQHFKENIIKTASDLEEQFKKDKEEKAKHEEVIMDITIKGMMGDEITKEDEEAYINAKKSIQELEQISKEYIYFTNQEKELNNIIDQFWNIEVDEMTEEEMQKDKQEHQILFEFC